MARGTDFPFQAAGYPDSVYGAFTFTPRSIPGAAKKPLYEGKTCFGTDLRNEPANSKFTLKYLIDYYNRSPDKPHFFNSFFDRLAGGPGLQQKIKLGRTEAEIRGSWDAGLFRYKNLRRKYRIYND